MLEAENWQNKASKMGSEKWNGYLYVGRLLNYGVYLLYLPWSWHANVCRGANLYPVMTLTLVMTVQAKLVLEMQLHAVTRWCLFATEKEKCHYTEVNT